MLETLKYPEGAITQLQRLKGLADVGAVIFGVEPRNRGIRKLKLCSLTDRSWRSARLEYSDNEEEMASSVGYWDIPRSTHNNNAYFDDFLFENYWFAHAYLMAWQSDQSKRNKEVSQAHT